MRLRTPSRMFEAENAQKIRAIRLGEKNGVLLGKKSVPAYVAISSYVAPTSYDGFLSWLGLFIVPGEIFACLAEFQLARIFQASFLPLA